MPLSGEDWHRRYQVQAQWTEALRLYFLDLYKKEEFSSILEIGCGTGALLPAFSNLSSTQLIGADLNLEHLELASQSCRDCGFIGCDVHQLPFEEGSFDLVFCHYFLLWVGDPGHALREMHRVTRSGGLVAAFAEPDFGGRIDYPTEFIQIREYQISSLLDSGADPRLGRKLKSLFTSGGFSDLEYGVYQGSWQDEISQEEIDSEWMVLSEDLAKYLTRAEILALRKHDQLTRDQGTRLTYLPTFYAWGRVQK